ncbi:hypothetical protein NKG94_01665 [Micromonospora sp. M12]
MLALVTLAATIGKGIFLTAGVLYFTRAVHLPAVRVGIGLSIAGLVALLAGWPPGTWPTGAAPAGATSARSRSAQPPPSPCCSPATSGRSWLR